MGSPILKPFVLMLGGTSLTAGRLCNPPIPWTEYLYNDMRAAPECQGPVVIINTGKGSQTSDFGASQAALMAPLRPTHVLMEDFGINDCAVGPVTIPQATANFNSMVASYRAARSDVVIVHQTMSPASAGDVNRTNLAAYYANGLANAALNGLLSLDNYNGTAIVPGGWVKPLPLELTVPDAGVPFAIAPTTGFVGMTAGTTWNPSDKAANISLSGGNLTATSTSASVGCARTTTSITGKVHIEHTVSGLPGIGAGNTSAGLTTSLGFNANSIGLYSDGNVFLNSVQVGVAGFSYVNGNVIAVEVDTANSLIYFMNSSVRSVGFDISAITGNRFPMLITNVSGNGVTSKFEGRTGDGLHPIWPLAFQTYSYPNIIAWAKQAMADFW